MRTPREPEDYLVARAKEALAADPRTGELGIEVSVSGGRVLISGVVTTEERKRAIAEVVREAVPDREIFDATTVEKMAPPGHEENLP
ncbi:MAG: BON domain-containing protein [Actinomycetota bacterium]|nr:BON domain-containing protein [Actinomycetota bacterium]